MGNVIPMFALTGHPEKADLSHKIKSFKQVGIDEVMAYPRSGCLVPYMSEEWFSVIENLISACEENDVKLWLYDEFNWPSGGCGGKVQKASWHYWSKKMIVEKKENEAFSNGEKVQILADSRYPDLLDEGGVCAFIKYTHEEYAKRFSDKFGSVILGFFTDEPCFNYIAERTDEIVYYDGMENDYKEKTGRDLFSDTVLYYQKKAPIGFMKNVFDILGERFETCYIRRLASWCENHRLVLTGHLLADTDIEQGTRTSGHTIKALESIHIPGIDDIQTRTTKGFRVWNAYLNIGKVKERTGKDTMIELFALGPSDMSMNRKKRSLYLAASYGVNRYFTAVAHLDAKGNYHKLRNYFNPECSVTPDYDKTKEFIKEAKRAVEYAKKKSEPDVYVRYPREKMLEYSDFERDKARKLEKNIEDLLYDLVNAQVYFAYLLEGEKGENVICADANGIYDERTGEQIEDVIAWCNERIERKVEVFENGRLAKDVFVKTFNDGSFIISDCTEEETEGREVEICVFGEKYTHTLLPQEVILNGDLEQEKEVEINPKFKKKADLGIIRFYLWEKQNFVAECDAEIRLLIRNYPIESKILLDGKEVKAENDCTKIGYGFNNLYKESEIIKLAKGNHTIEALGDIEERLYIPVCIGVGSFESAGNRIFECESEGNTAYFFGKCEFTTDVKIPENAKKIKFLSTDTFTKLYINDDYIGESALSRISFEIPDKFKGQNVKLKFEQTSTIAPLFGTTESDYCNEKNDTPDWNKTFGVIQKPHGITKIRFTY